MLVNWPPSNDPFVVASLISVCSLWPDGATESTTRPFTRFSDKSTLLSSNPWGRIVQWALATLVCSPATSF
jgi:hypothetical protein